MKTLKLLIKTSFLDKINDFLCFKIFKYIFDRRSNKLLISHIIKINTLCNETTAPTFNTPMKCSDIFSQTHTDKWTQQKRYAMLSLCGWNCTEQPTRSLLQEVMKRTLPTVQTCGTNESRRIKSMISCLMGGNGNAIRYSMFNVPFDTL